MGVWLSRRWPAAMQIMQGQIMRALAPALSSRPPPAPAPLAAGVTLHSLLGIGRIDTYASFTPMMRSRKFNEIVNELQVRCAPTAARWGEGAGRPGPWAYSLHPPTIIEGDGQSFRRAA